MTLKIGHRGAMGYEPENTLSSFKKALDLHVDMIELDVYLCQTGEVVVIHDNKLDKVTNCQGYIADRPFSELDQCLVGNREKIPTLSQVLDLIDRKAKVNIELKGDGTARAVAQVVDDYVKNKGWLEDDFLVSSFDHYQLKEFKAMSPNIKIGALTANIPINYAQFAQELDAYSVHLSSDFINEKFVQDAHQRGLKVFVWVVNYLEDLKRMEKFGVDGVFSDYPDRL